MCNILDLTYDLPTTHLDLSCRNITSEMISELFENINDITNLKFLDLSNNELIEDMPENIFDKLSDLEHLDLSCNNLSSIPKNIFDKLTNLTHLDISYNDLSSIPANIFNKLTNLRYLYLYDNQIMTKDLPRKIFKRLTKLTHLHINDLYTNNILQRYIKAPKEEKLKQKMKLAKIRTAIFKEELYMKTLHYSKINLLDVFE
jgi:Leucine-rich repeat (LRR) protein